MDLSGRVALVTGTRRIGSSVAVALAARGADVALAYNQSKTEAETAADAVRAAGRRALVVQADLSQAVACAALVQAVDAAWGRLDVLVNLASVYRAVPFDQLDL